MRAGLLQGEVREEAENSYVVKTQRLQLTPPGDRMIQAYDQAVPVEILSDPLDSGRYGRRRRRHNGGGCLGAAGDDYTYHTKCRDPQAFEIHNS
jgi:hypothetical protein